MLNPCNKYELLYFKDLIIISFNYNGIAKI